MHEAYQHQRESYPALPTRLLTDASELAVSESVILEQSNDAGAITQADAAGSPVSDPRAGVAGGGASAQRAAALPTNKPCGQYIDNASLQWLQ